MIMTIHSSFLPIRSINKIKNRIKDIFSPSHFERYKRKRTIKMIRIKTNMMILILALAITPAISFMNDIVNIHCRKENIKIHSTSRGVEDLYGAIHRKEYEITQLAKQHKSTTDPVRMAMGYLQENIPPLRLARALRRVYEDPNNPANPDCVPLSEEDKKTEDKFGRNAMAMRRGCFVADIKRKSLSSPGETFVNFNDASLVAKAMVEMGADCVFVNVDYGAYGGDIDELKSSIKAVRKVSGNAAVIMKDIVVDELQIGLAKEADAGNSFDYQISFDFLLKFQNIHF